jgi:histidyl-tRNA synthetase
MAARERIIATIRSVYELYGFTPLGTPAIEFLEVLSGSAGTEVQESIFKVGNPDRGPHAGEDALGLRFDLTVPLARVVAQYRELPRPFRRYQVASVWRADKPDPGRFREFTQFDIDSVGAPTSVADVEIIAAMCDTLTALEVGRYRVRFSSRKILNLLLKLAAVPEQFEMTIRKRSGPDSFSEERVQRPGSDVFRVLDKLDKVGVEKVRLELTKGYRDDSGDFIAGLGLASEQVARIEEFVAISADARAEVLRRLEGLFAGLEGAAAEIEVLASMSEQLAALGYGDDRVALDLSIARGLAYYTGPVFEAVLLDAPRYGSVFGGGRYDELVTRFTGERIPATGASIGVDRLLAALIELGSLKLRKTPTQVLVTTLDPTMTNDYLALTFELRRAGIPAEMYLGGKKNIGKQMKYADEQDIPIVLLYGGDEKAKGVVTLRDMVQGRLKAQAIEGHEEWIKQRPGQVEVARGELVAGVRQMLAQ